MKSALQSLMALMEESTILRKRPFSSGINPREQLSRLLKTEEQLRTKSEVVRLRPTRLDPAQTWSRWEATGFQSSALDGLAFRTLCCSTETGLRVQLIQEVGRKPARLKNSRCLYGWVHVYFSRWRDMDKPVDVETLILATLAIYDKKGPIIQSWRDNRWLFSEVASDKLVELLVSDQGSIDALLKKHHVAIDTQLALKVRGHAATRAVEQFRLSEVYRGAAWAISYFQWITKEVLSDLTLRVPFFSAIGSLILSKSAANSDAFRQALRVYVQANPRLGDPRLLETGPNWRSIEPEARQLYLSWLAQDNIIFFFNTILPDNNGNRRRKDFWLRYHRRIRDFQVAVSETGESRIRSNQNAAKLLYSRVSHATTSAFLMEFEARGKRYVIVEFSETANAAYVFSKTDFEAAGVNLRTQEFDLKSQLKSDKKIDRILHPPSGWEEKASYWLASEIGLVP